LHTQKLFALLCFDVYDYDKNPNLPIFEIEKHQFLKLLDILEIIFKEEKQEIIITYENGMINVQGEN